MNKRKLSLCALSLFASATASLLQTAKADDQTKVGAGNPAAIALAQKSPLVQSAYKFLLSQAAKIKDAQLRKATLDALGDGTCVQHRANMTDAQKDAIIATLIAQKLV